MTLAACFVTGEGVVLGADSAATAAVGGEPHYFNHAQKLFQIDDAGDVGLVVWGHVLLPHRTVLARFSDSLKAKPPSSVKDVAERWAKDFRAELEKVHQAELVQGRTLQKTKDGGGKLSPDEEKTLANMLAAGAGCCIGGRMAPDREPHAYGMYFKALDVAAPAVEAIVRGVPYFWGAPSLVDRLIVGIDPGLQSEILGSGHWKGSKQDLETLVLKHAFEVYRDLPMRDAVDFVYSSIYTTIKGMKFSQLPPVCGGPIEIAVITSDRPFRWVRHKAFDAALFGL